MEKLKAFFSANKTTIIVVLIIIAALAIVILTTKPETKKDEKPLSVFPLTVGSKGDEVKYIQAWLNSKGSNLQTDGIYGPLTAAEVLRVLKVNEISEELYKTITI